MGQGLFLGSPGPSLFNVLSPGAKHLTNHPLPGIQFLFFTRCVSWKHPVNYIPMELYRARGCNTVFPEVNQTGKHMLPHIGRLYLHAIAKLYHNGIGNLGFDMSKMSRVLFNYLF